MTSDGQLFHLGYHRSLDGLRGVAILLVLFFHGGILLTGGAGFIGVDTFFVLSGFLITSLLIMEYDESNDISLRHFYLRRALRLLPALLTMLLVFVTIAFLSEPRRDVIQEVYGALQALFYFTNWAIMFSIGTTSAFGHTWSLSLEEQFYLVWPLLLLFFLRKSDRKSLLCWVLLGMFLSAATRVLLFVGSSVWAHHSDRMLVGPDTRADSLLAGCFAGIVVSSNLLPRWNLFIKALKISAMISIIGLVLIGCFHPRTPWMMCVGWLLTSVFAAILITHLVSNSHSGIHWVFENPILVYIGRISYGLYVWHYPILIFMKQHQLPWQNLGYLPPVFVVTLASYYLIESPCLRLKGRFARIK